MLTIISKPLMVPDESGLPTAFESHFRPVGVNSLVRRLGRKAEPEDFSPGGSECVMRNWHAAGLGIAGASREEKPDASKLCLPSLQKYGMSFLTKMRIPHERGAGE